MPITKTGQYAKPMFQESLDEKQASALLTKQSKTDKQTVAERLNQARQELEAAVSEARETIRMNPLSNLVAANAAREKNRRGTPYITVASTGDVLLEIHYASSPLRQEMTPMPTEEDLPNIEELRKRARDMNIDPTPFGRSRTKLLAAIQARVAILNAAVGNGTVVPPTRNFHFRTSQAVSSGMLMPSPATGIYRCSRCGTEEPYGGNAVNLGVHACPDGGTGQWMAHDTE